MDIEILNKAHANLDGKGIGSRITNNTLYVVLDDVELELAEFEIEYQPKEFDE